MFSSSSSSSPSEEKPGVIGTSSSRMTSPVVGLMIVSGTGDGSPLGKLGLVEVEIVNDVKLGLGPVTISSVEELEILSTHSVVGLSIVTVGS